MRFTWLVLLFCMCRPLVAQSLGTIEVYRYGRVSSAFPLMLDGQVKLKLAHLKKLVLPVQPGEHQLTYDSGIGHAAVVLEVRAGETTYATFDYEHLSGFALLTTRDKSQVFSFALEHVNAPPDGEYKAEDLSPKDLAAVAALPSMHKVLLPATQDAPLETLTDSDIRDALLQGSHTAVPSTIGLLLDDAQRRFGSALAEGQGVSGFSLRLYTAKQWIELQASEAARQMRPYGVGDITPAMRSKKLYVIATPSTPDRLDGRNMAAASNVQRIVLEVGPSKAVVQPLEEEKTSVRLDSALRSADYEGVMASFPQPDISKSFNVVVIGDADRKEFQVKDKHLNRLR